MSIAGQRPASDELLAQFADHVNQVREHNHPKHEDFFCLNLVAYMGERMGAVLKRLEDEQTLARDWRQRYETLAAQIEGQP